jgi:hypothetical protein
MKPFDLHYYWKSVAALLIVIAAGAGAGRICATSRVWEPEFTKDGIRPNDTRGPWPSVRPRPMPTFGSNDRSRWDTVRALIDEHTSVIGRRDRQTILTTAITPIAAPDPLQAINLSVAGYQVRVTSSTPTWKGADSGIVFEDGWTSIDKVLNPQTLEYYSSKPPLFTTAVAGLYWLLQSLFGWKLKDDPFTVVRTVLILVNLVPFVVYLSLLAKLFERCSANPWTRTYLLGAACFATLVTPFLITLNNHNIATYCVLFAIYPVFGYLTSARSASDGSAQPVAGAPGWGSEALRFVFSGLLAGFAIANELPAAAFTAALGGILLLKAPRQTLLYFAPGALIVLAAFVATNYAALGEFDLAYDKFGGPWYEYEGSIWRRPPEGTEKYGIDWAKKHETRTDYTFNVLIGHHGLFSLTPIWLFAFGGMIWASIKVRSAKCEVRSAKSDGQSPDSEPSPPQIALRTSHFALLTFLVTVVVVGYYLTEYRGRNYGGWTSGLRWLMWLTPLWLLTMLPVVDWLSHRRWGRWLALLFLGWSVFSASYPAWNPWRHPWLYNWLDSGGYIPY